MILFNYILDNDIIYFSLFTRITLGIGYSFASSFFNSVYSDKMDKGVQTSA